ncbi:MAG: hypothetical protein IBX57_00555 [Gammaproteobacteria bacterium]|nr:hypothetical protein [Gammaproteobacteria bacterium]
MSELLYISANDTTGDVITVNEEDLKQSREFNLDLLERFRSFNNYDDEFTNSHWIVWVPNTMVLDDLMEKYVDKDGSLSEGASVLYNKIKCVSQSLISKIMREARDDKLAPHYNTDPFYGMLLDVYEYRLVSVIDDDYGADWEAVDPREQAMMLGKVKHG